MKSAESTNDQNTITEDDAQHLIRLEQQRADACLGYDLAILDRLLPGDFTFTSPPGIVMGKTSVMESLGKDELNFETLQRECKRVMIHQNTALVCGEDVSIGHFRDQRLEWRYDAILSRMPYDIIIRDIMSGKVHGRPALQAGYRIARRSLPQCSQVG